MTMIITLFLVLALAALIYWGVSQLPLPPVVRTVVIVLMGIVLIVYLANSLGHVSLR